MHKNKKFWQNKKVFITGFSGFLGSHLTLALLNEKARIVGIDIKVKRKNSILRDCYTKFIALGADVRNFTSILELLNKYRPEIIFHLAAQALVGEANQRPLLTFTHNIEGTWNILEAARRCKFIKGIIISSSDKAYGITNKLPYKEESQLFGVYPYDVSKSCADLISYTYFRSFGLRVCVTRCGNIYGPGDFHFQRIVPDTIRQALLGRSLFIRSNGRFTRDYIYVNDVVSGYLLLAQIMEEKGLFGEAFNFSNERPINVLQLVKMIYRLVGKKPKYRILNQAELEIEHQYLSSRKAQKILGWQPKEDLNSGLLKTIAWYRRLFKK